MSNLRAPKCTACGKEFVNHNGIEPTCARLQEALKALDEVLNAGDFVGAMGLLPFRISAEKARAVLEANKP